MRIALFSILGRRAYKVIMRLLRLSTVVLLLELVGCIGPRAPFFPEVASTIPPVPPDRGRIYFYRDDEPYESLSRPYLYLNGEVAGVSIPGGVFYRDVPPGMYTIATWTQGDFPDGSKTAALRPGDTFYVKVESLRSWQSGNARYVRDTFIVVLIDPRQAQSELTRMHYAGEAAS
jgi:hypothetical protein